MAAMKLAACALLAQILSASGSRAFRKGQASSTLRQPENGDEYEYGDRESQVSHGDASDFSIHQFLVSDDARDGAADSGSAGESRAKALAADDHFNSEDTPDNSDSFAQTARRVKKAKQMPGDGSDDYEYGDRESAVSHSDASDFSIHQFLVSDDARDGAADSGSAGESRAKALAADDHFNSEDTPDSSDSFAQVGRSSKKAHARQMPGDEDQDEYEYGDRESQVSHGDASDFSIHQFLVADDARDGSASSDTADASMAKAKALAADDHFNSEDTPDNSDSFAQTARRVKKAKQMPGGGSDEYEYGDRESAVSHSDASDFSIHQFLVSDDARDGSAAGGDAAESAARSKAADDHFNSEDTPDSSDSFTQTGRRHAQKASPQLSRFRA